MPTQLTSAVLSPDEKSKPYEGPSFFLLSGAFAFEPDPKHPEMMSVCIARCIRHEDCGASWRLCLDDRGEIRRGDAKALSQHANRMERL